MSLESLPTETVLDVSGTLARFGGDEQLFREIIEFFIEDAPPLLAELKHAAQMPYPAVVRSAAHSLKGLTSGCGGVRAALAAQKIERAAQDGDFSDLATMIEDLENEIELLKIAAAAYRY